ncbi:MAG: polyprenyl diphosphate synthase [Pseudomonadota bacterium]
MKALATDNRTPAPLASLRMPAHVAIVMDGNGRWAKRRGKPRTYGHRRGARAARAAVEFCVRNGISNLTLFAFSSENWSRPAEEVNVLMTLFLRALKNEVRDLIKYSVRLRFIGDLSRFSPQLQDAMHKAVHDTGGGQKLNLHIAVNYGGRWDLTQAARRLAEQVERGELMADEIDEERLRGALSLADVPEPDLFIRTGGEVRISNFLIWQLAYTELYFTDLMWPDFDAAAFHAAVARFNDVQRRFGQTDEQVQASQSA